MENWKKNSRKDIVMVDVDALVPQDHLLRKIEKVMDYEWLYERLEPYYCHDNGRPGTDPVVLIKMVLIAFVRNTVSAADLPGNSGECSISVVSWVWAAG